MQVAMHAARGRGAVSVGGEIEGKSRAKRRKKQISDCAFFVHFRHLPALLGLSFYVSTIYRKDEKGRKKVGYWVGSSFFLCNFAA